MALYILLPLSLLAFLFFHYVVTPRVKKSESDNRWVKKIGKPALLAILKYVYTFFFIATLTYALLILITLAMSLSGASTSAGYESTIIRIQGYRDAFKVFKSYWALAIFVLIFVAVTALLYRRLKRAIEDDVKDEKQRLKAEEGSEGWESLEPTPEMFDVAQKIYVAQQLFDALDASVRPQTEETQNARRALKEKIQQLRAQWHDLDLERRAYRNLEARQGGTASRRESKVRTFLGSKGLLESVQSFGRGVGYAGLVLLFLSLVGVNAPLVDRALAQRIVRLSDLQVKANQKEARESFARLLAEQSDEGERELKQDDEKALRDLSRHFERSFTSSHVWNVPYVYRDRSAEIRKSLVKDKIIAIHVEKPGKGPDSPKDDGGGGGSPDDKGPGPDDGAPPAPEGGGTGPDNRGPETDQPGKGKGRQPSSPKTPQGEGGGKGRSLPRSEQPSSAGSTTARRTSAPPSVEDIRTRLASNELPRTGIGERFSNDVRKGIIGRSKKFWASIKANLADFTRKFGEPFETLEFGKWVAGEMMGATVDSAWHYMPNIGELNEPVKGMTKAGLKDAAKKIPTAGVNGQDLQEAAQRVYDLSFEQFMTDLGEGMPLEQALQRVEAGVPGRPVGSIEDLMKLRVVSQELLSSEVFKDLEKSLMDSPPTLAEPSKDVAEARTAAERLGKTLDATGRSNLPAEEFEKIYAVTDTYEDHYPGRGGARELTSREMLESKMQNKPPDPARSAEIYAQSRDFSQLKFSTDVGGVLIGRAPDKIADNVDFRDLSWTLSGDKVTLRLKRADGSDIVLGPYARETVSNALVYVADNRKVVVTIQNAYWDRKKQASVRRIFLHPALVDTTLGNDIIEFDGLVFKLTKGDPQREASEQRIEAQELLYALAWRNRRQALCELLIKQGTDNSDLRWLKAQIVLDTGNIKALLKNDGAAAAIQSGLRDARKIGDKETSLLRQYPVYFDPQLVSTIVVCGGQSGGSSEKFGKCVRDDLYTLAKYSIPGETVSKWLDEPAETSHRSIAEERPYRVDAALSFLSPEESAQPAAQLWPFEFRYEIAFPSDAPFMTEEKRPEAYRTPWEYRELRPLIAEKVSLGIESDAKKGELFRRVRDFTVLQRLFRISLDGGIGAQFPIEKLAELMRATAGGNPHQETPRWEIKRPSED